MAESATPPPALALNIVDTAIKRGVTRVGGNKKAFSPATASANRPFDTAVPGGRFVRQKTRATVVDGSGAVRLVTISPGGNSSRAFWRMRVSR